MRHYDLIIIGSGPAGYVGAVRAAQHGMNTAIIEKEPTLYSCAVCQRGGYRRHAKHRGGAVKEAMLNAKEKKLILDALGAAKKRRRIMNVFTRVWTVIQSHINAWIEKWEDPERSLEQTIRDMQKQVNRVRGDVINVLAEEKKLKNQVEKYQKEVERWEKNAVLALKEGNENLAREALRRKKEALDYTQQLHPQWEQQQTIAARLKQEYHDLRNRIDDAQRKKRHLVLRLRHAETQKRLQGLITDLSDNQVFAQLESKILDTEAMNEAQQELQDNSLDHKFHVLESTADLDIDHELEAMKKRMELNP